MAKISIYRDGVWAGDGRLVAGHIEDCAAVLCRDGLDHSDGSQQDASDATYEAIEEAVEEGQDEVEVDGYTYSWAIEE